MNSARSMTFTSSEIRSLWLTTAAGLFIVGASVAAVVGGMKYVIIALAVLIARWVYKKPNEGIAAGTVFLIACNVVFPPASRFDWATEPWEMRYWASGLLIITLAAGVGIGVRNLLRVPAAAKVFLLVAVAAAIMGLSKGGSLSYVGRQLYGSILLVVYFAIAYRIGNQELFLRRLRTVGLLGAIGFFFYYAAVYSEYGFHKELTVLGTLEGAIAILCSTVGLTRKSLAWTVSGLIMLGVPLLLFARHAFLMGVLGILVALANIATTKKTKFIMYAASALLLIPSIFPWGAELILERLLNSRSIERMLPSGASDASSLADRGLELVASIEVLRGSPLLGDGFGNELVWDSPAHGAAFAQAYVDNGWGYIAVKMGALGLLAFGWFLFIVLRCLSRNALPISVSLLAIVLVAQFSEPAFFQFSTAPLCGALAGLLVARRPQEVLHLAGGSRLEARHA
jgi:hypothetical protein